MGFADILQTAIESVRWDAGGTLALPVMVTIPVHQRFDVRPE